MVNKKVALIGGGIFGLAVGSLEYLLWRPSSAGYFLKHFPSSYTPFINVPKYLGQWAVGTPSFLHTFSFSIISIGLFSNSHKSRFGFCFLWFAIDSLFEIGQKYGTAVAAYVPTWFSHIPFLENTKNYFMHGGFETFELVAYFFGALTAYVIAELILMKRR